MKHIKLYEEYVLKNLEDQYDIKLDLWEGKEHLVELKCLKKHEVVELVAM